MEEGILRFWEENDIFKRSISQREGNKDYVFYDGPPFATGLPHFGHFVPGTIKDIIPRYWSMKGRRVERRFGWDCHGLPVEYEMEKELGISGRREIEDYGISKFNESCRGIVLRYTKEWRSVITRLGRWVDFDNDYKTMEPDYMESIKRPPFRGSGVHRRVDPTYTAQRAPTDPPIRVVLFTNQRALGAAGTHQPCCSRRLAAATRSTD